MMFYSLVIYTICLYGPMAAMSIAAGLVFVLFFGAALKDRQFIGHSLLVWRQTPLLVPTFLLVFACVWSLVWAKLTALKFLGMQPSIQWIVDSAKLWHILFPFILLALFSKLSNNDLKKLTSLWIIFGFISALLGIVQHYVPLYNPLPLPDVGLEGYFHATGMTGFHLSYASILGFPTGVWLALFAVQYRRRGFFHRQTMVFFVGSLLFFIANIFTYSKITWLAIPLTILLLTFLGISGRLRIALILATLVFSSIWVLSPEVRLRFQGTDTIKERIEVWSANLKMIHEFPLFGVGWHHNSELSQAYYQSKNMSGFQSHAHNNIIDQWASTGFLGLIAFLWWSLVPFVMAMRIYQNNHDFLWRALGLGLVGGWFYLHFNGLTQTNFWDAKVLHQIGWVAAITMEVYRRFYRPYKTTSLNKSLKQELLLEGQSR